MIIGRRILQSSRQTLVGLVAATLLAWSCQRALVAQDASGAQPDTTFPGTMDEGDEQDTSRTKSTYKYRVKYEDEDLDKTESVRSRSESQAYEEVQQRHPDADSILLVEIRRNGERVDRVRRDRETSEEISDPLESGTSRSSRESFSPFEELQDNRNSDGQRPVSGGFADFLTRLGLVDAYTFGTESERQLLLDRYLKGKKQKQKRKRKTSYSQNPPANSSGNNAPQNRGGGFPGNNRRNGVGPQGPNGQGGGGQGPPTGSDPGSSGNSNSSQNEDGKKKKQKKDGKKGRRLGDQVDDGDRKQGSSGANSSSGQGDDGIGLGSGAPFKPDF